MKPVLIDASDPVDAWRKTVCFLAASGDTFNVVVSIADPVGFSNHDLTSYDPRKQLKSARSVEDVANTIFPKQSHRWNMSDTEFAKHYGKAYKNLLNRGPRSWGMYFLRLIDFGDARINQLESVVRGLSGWGKNHKAAFVIHLSSSETDSPRPLGAPCLQFCEFLRQGEKLSLLAVYRSHDYYLKALGNFVGLARLLQYVAQRAGLPVGSIVCHSTYAYLANNKRRAIALIDEGRA